MCKVYFLLIMVIFGSLQLSAQFDLPTTQILCSRIGIAEDSSLIAYDHTLIRGIESSYVNQVRFHSEDEFVLTAENPSRYTDIYHVNLEDESMTRLSASGFSEFSPYRTGTDALFTLTVEDTGDDSNNPQRLWYHDFRQNASVALFPQVNNIGYFEPLSSTQVALFLIHDVPRLAIGDVSTSKMNYFITGGGRCMRRINDEELAFVHIIDESTRYIKVYNYITGQKSFVIGMPGDGQDFAMLDDGSYLSMDGHKLMIYHPDRHSSWQLLHSYESLRTHRTSRIATNGVNRIAIIYE